ncbi:TonB-dependent receptor [Bradyrhizobium canariense]|uniref:TonB-dependent receptor n=1 Tax=Bradyrhizobium canariense TaxID=255045 RepID=UPI0018D30507|nr:TonB-dependent siderophore receptor [Bradyrhizobium canariense]
MKIEKLVREPGVGTRVNNRVDIYQRGRAYCHAGFFCIAMVAFLPASVQAQTTDRPTSLPPVQIDAPKNRPAQKRAPATATAAAKRRTARSNQPPKPAAQTAAVVDTGNGPNNNNSGPPLQQAPSLGKTGTKLEDLPVSVQIIPREVLTEQGTTTLRDAVTNASGINTGGQDSLGYFDHFLIRGLNAQVYTDGFSDGDQLGGLTHTLNGVRRIEILEGPGSALFGSGPPGGTINIVHYDPSPVFHWGSSLQAGSFGTVINSNYVTGPTTIDGLNYRIDTTFSRADGFRDLASRDYEVRPEFTWHVQDHTLTFALDARHIEQTPDSYGLIYLNGSPITGVSTSAKYSTPFSFADQDYIRPTLTDKWDVTDFLTINNRFSYTHRDIDVMRNNDSMSSTGTHIVGDTLVGRQLRSQDDSDGSLDYQFEPVWKFGTGSVQHTLLTGFEYQHQVLDTQRRTADLPNIANIFAPTPPELSPASLNFQCDAKHSCDNDHLVADYYGFYATDQMDLTDKWKLRVGLRQDFYHEVLDPLITVPGRFTNTGVPLIAGVPESRNDSPVSWNVGTLYKIYPGISPYVGVSKSYLSNFNSENTFNGIGAPESALQYEAGVKFSMFHDKVVLDTSAFNISRDNVATLFSNSLGQESVAFDSQLINGVEASLDAAITEQWHLLANATAMEAVVTNAPQALTTVGNHPQGVPAYMANLWSTYKFSIGGVPGFQVGAGVNYRDKTYSDTTNVNSVPAFVIGNAMIGWDNANWGVALNVKNITNERYFVAANGAGGFVGEGLGAFVTVRYHE